MLKNIVAVIASEKVGMVVDALKNAGVGGFTVLDAIDIRSKQKGIHAI